MSAARQLSSGACIKGESFAESNTDSSDNDSSSSSSRMGIDKIQVQKKKAKGVRVIRRSLQVIVAIVAGVLFLTYFEGFTFVNALYVITQMVTTVGYGDITLKNEWGMLFIAFYALWILVLIAFYLNTVVSKILSEQEEVVRAKLRALEKQLFEQFFQSQVSGSIQDEDVKEAYGKYNSLIFSTVIFAGHLLVGTLLFEKMEGLSLIKAFYTSVITLTTIGFGDFSPSQDASKVVSIFWMLSGIVSAANFVQNLQVVFFNIDAEQRFRAEAIDCEEMFAAMDFNSDGTLSQGEFIQYCLLKQRLVDPEILRRIVEVYDRIDSNDDNQLTVEEMRRFKSAVVNTQANLSTMKQCSVM